METAQFETDLSLFKYDNLEQLPAAYRELDGSERTERIEAALAELGDDVVILGHNYQRQEIVEHADFVGDSYQLSKAAADADAEYVVFGGVTFMAESADIITDDDQTVILPSMEASCPMAGMAASTCSASAIPAIGQDASIDGSTTVWSSSVMMSADSAMNVTPQKTT